MQPPKCPICGKAEWRHLCSGAAPSEIARRAEYGVTPARNSVTKMRNTGVTPPRNKAMVVTPPVTACADCKRLRAELKAVRAEAEALQAEVMMLKRRLADRHGTERPVAVPAAERMRRMRAKRKEQQHV